ncbi:TPA: alpha-N-arabinofuranosidase, partial [Candidatus Sumerlaeota bacterium]|nr:alpha-N-arabinofuranosidase [Candidatus Sumerlaeota bacterium]
MNLRSTIRTVLCLSSGCLLLSSGIANAEEAAPPSSSAVTFTVDASAPGPKVSPILYGLMTEEINHCYDGGLYAELIQNRAFKDDAKKPTHWTVVQPEGAGAKISLDGTKPLNDKLDVSLHLDAASVAAKTRVGIANDGYWGIPVKPDTKYRASFQARAGAASVGPVTVAIESEDGKTVYASAQVPSLTTEWKAYEVTLKTEASATATTKTRFVITADAPCDVWFSLVSLFPPTWKDQPNGFRPDLMQMMVDMKPGFLRFPGGNYLEGDTVATRFEWKKTLGPLTERAGHPCPWSYRSTDGMGLLEFLLWCENMNAEPLLGVYAGYSLKGETIKAGPELEPFVQEALEEIEYVTGDASTKWGAQRIKDGYPQPFKLRYVEIGNEDFFDRSGSYEWRFAQFYDAIKAKYP